MHLVFDLMDLLASHFFSIVGERIKIHSTSSGKVVSTLPGPHDDGHEDIITSAILSAHNPFQLITASLDGTLKIWDFLEGVLLFTINLEQPIHHVCAHEKIKDYVFVAAAKAKKGSNDADGECFRLNVLPPIIQLLFEARSSQNHRDLQRFHRTRAASSCACR